MDVCGVRALRGRGQVRHLRSSRSKLTQSVGHGVRREKEKQMDNNGNTANDGRHFQSADPDAYDRAYGQATGFPSTKPSTITAANVMLTQYHRDRQTAITA